MKKRIAVAQASWHRGFSLVEMMLILLITSLMLASGVAVVSKKHVKVPKISVHGSYMCYYKNGRLHEEQYVGPGLTKKIMDRDTNRCEFTPPERAGYLYFQATAGGGGGGDSGYQGGNLQVFQSATEVITPFGLTQGILDLKGISTGELSSLGGTMYAYANATGKQLAAPGGDAGDGGDVYYIQQDCSSDCIVNRESWKYTGSQERKCECDSATKSSTAYTYNYSYNCSYYTYPSCTGYYCDGCYSYRTTSCTGYSCDGCYSHSWWDSDYCTNGYDYTSYCEDGYDRIYHPKTCYSTCTDEYNRPVSASCSKSNYQNLTVETKDVYAQDSGYNPPYRMDYKTGCTNCIEPQLTPDNAMVERKVLRDETNTYSICNYGNPNKFTGGDGVFGSFAGYDPVSVSCSTSGIMNAFGDDIFPMGGGQTALSLVQVKYASEVYNQEVKYDRSEELGLDSAYGTSCTNTAYGTCKSETKNNTAFTNPVTGTYYPTTESLPTSCSIPRATWTTTNSYGCSGKNTYGSASVSHPSYSIYTACRCVQNNSSGSKCMYSYDQVTEEDKRCKYIPQVAKGGTGGFGKSCTTNTVNAGLGITYTAKSDVIPGIRGSDKNCTGAGYFPLYTKSAWASQPGNCYAQNGTDSKGSAMINLNGNSCTVNIAPPTKGQGARKTGSGGTAATAGQSAPVNGSGRAEGTYSLSGASLGGSGCDTQHVGYCVKGRPNYKYSYKYTWNTNYLQYGEGGKAGSYNVKLIRSIKDGTFVISPGRGGAGGAVGTGNSGDDGENTVVQFMPADGSAGQQILFAAGGAGGPGGLVTPTEQLPTWYSGGDFTAGENGTPGETISITNMKSNIMNLVLPTGDNNILNQWLNASGAGGDGGGSRNYCWASEWQRWFEGTRVKGNRGYYLDENDMRTIACRQGTYWSATPAAQDGIAGVVIIRW